MSLKYRQCDIQHIHIPSWFTVFFHTPPRIDDISVFPLPLSEHIARELRYFEVPIFEDPLLFATLDDEELQQNDKGFVRMVSTEGTQTFYALFGYFLFPVRPPGTTPPEQSLEEKIRKYVRLFADEESPLHTILKHVQGFSKTPEEAKQAYIKHIEKQRCL